MPATKSNGDYYEPLTDSDKEDMSETAIANYEEKAKQGVLFGDSDLSTLYSKMLTAITSASSDGTLKSMGISTSYSNGLTTLVISDESALENAINTDLDSVRDAFTASTSNGSSKNGIMQNLKVQLDNFAKVTGTKGILVNKAGSSLAPTSLYSNTLQSMLDSIDSQIEKWQDKMSDQVDYYTTKFTSLETLISQMNSQSSMLSSLTGGY
jgi:flagellar hook-associated protein 2